MFGFRYYNAWIETAEERNYSSSDTSSDSTLPEDDLEETSSDKISNSEQEGIFQFDSSDDESFHSSADRFEDDDGSSFARTFSDDNGKSPVLFDVADSEFPGKLDAELMAKQRSHADV